MNHDQDHHHFLHMSSRQSISSSLIIMLRLDIFQLACHHCSEKSGTNDLRISKSAVCIRFLHNRTKFLVSWKRPHISLLLWMQLLSWANNSCARGVVRSLLLVNQSFISEARVAETICHPLTAWFNECHVSAYPNSLHVWKKKENFH